MKINAARDPRDFCLIIDIGLIMDFCLIKDMYRYIRSSLGPSQLFPRKYLCRVSWLNMETQGMLQLLQPHQASCQTPIIQVAFPKGLWWSIPPDMSLAMYTKYVNGEDVCYTWDWGDTREGSWMPNDDPHGFVNAAVH